MEAIGSALTRVRKLAQISTAPRSWARRFPMPSEPSVAAAAQARQLCQNWNPGLCTYRRSCCGPDRLIRALSFAADEVREVNGTLTTFCPGPTKRSVASLTPSTWHEILNADPALAWQGARQAEVAALRSRLKRLRWPRAACDAHTHGQKGTGGPGCALPAGLGGQLKIPGWAQ